MRGAGTKDWALPHMIEFRLARHADVVKYLLETQPHEAWLRIRRVRYARLGQWELAGETSEIEKDVRNLTELTRVQVFLCDLAKYQATKRRAEQVSGPTFLRPDYRISVLGMTPLSAEEAKKLLALAEERWAKGPQHKYNACLLGLALYRCGRHAEAVERLSVALGPADGWQFDAVVWPVLAMAHHHLGHALPAHREPEQDPAQQREEEW